MKQLLKTMSMLAVLLLAIGSVYAQSLAPAEPQRQGELANPNVDAAGYDAHKAAFVAEHPREYAAMNPNPTKEADQTVYPWGAVENKQEWVTAHPQEYQAYLESLSSGRVTMTRAEFNKLSTEHQARVRQDAHIIVLD